LYFLVPKKEEEEAYLCLDISFDEEEVPKKEKKYQKGNKKGNKRKVFKKNLYSKEDSSSFDEDSDSDND